LAKWQDIKLIYKKQYPLYTNNEQTKKKIRETIPFTIASKE
jgi:hypothetical protein